MSTTNQVNFTEDHKKELEGLFVNLSFEGVQLAGKFGTNTMSPYDLLHNASSSTLKSLYNQLKNEITKAEENEDEWTSSDYEQRQLSSKKEWKKFLYLLIGYRKYLTEKAKNSEALRQMKAKLAELKESNKSPEDQMKELQDAIARMEGSEVPAEA